MKKKCCEYVHWDRIHKTSFSLYFMYGYTKLESVSLASLFSISVIGLLGQFVNYNENEVVWMRSQNCIDNC